MVSLIIRQKPNNQMDLQCLNNFLGIKVELFLDQDNYMLQKLSKNAGSKLVIHDPSLPPLPDEYGIDMQPNTASSIALQTVSVLILKFEQFVVVIKIFHF